jgi:hypothetical protein
MANHLSMLIPLPNIPLPNSGFPSGIITLPAGAAHKIIRFPAHEPPE